MKNQQLIEFGKKVVVIYEMALFFTYTQPSEKTNYLCDLEIF